MVPNLDRRRDFHFSTKLVPRLDSPGQGSRPPWEFRRFAMRVRPCFISSKGSVLEPLSPNGIYGRVGRRTRSCERNSMKAYVMTTGAVFGLITLVHIWRLIEEWPR